MSKFDQFSPSGKEVEQDSRDKKTAVNDSELKWIAKMIAAEAGVKFHGGEETRADVLNFLRIKGDAARDNVDLDAARLRQRKEISLLATPYPNVIKIPGRLSTAELEMIREEADKSREATIAFVEAFRVLDHETKRTRVLRELELSMPGAWFVVKGLLNQEGFDQLTNELIAAKEIIPSSHDEEKYHDTQSRIFRDFKKRARYQVYILQTLSKYGKEKGKAELTGYPTLSNEEERKNVEVGKLIVDPEKIKKEKQYDLY